MNTTFKSESVSELLKLTRKARLASKNEWLFLELHHKGQITLVKSFNTSIQILRKNGISYPSGWDLSASDWQEAIRHALEA